VAVLNDGPTSFRRAGTGDVTVLVDLVESAYRGERSRAGWSTEADLLDGQRVDAGMMEAAVSSPDALVLVLVDGDGRPLACCELRRPPGPGPATFGMFAVEPSRQAHGLGRRVLAEAERVVAEEWGLDRLRMTVIEQRSELIAWYRRRGYAPTGESEPFPYGDERYGLPRRDDLRFVVLERDLGPRD
jgi:GNAT superfamily N-acetyltransferase